MDWLLGNIKKDPREYYNDLPDQKCAICQLQIELQDPSYRSACEHKFHTKCHYDEFKKGKYKCPICQKTIGSTPISALSEDEKQIIKDCFKNMGKK